MFAPYKTAGAAAEPGFVDDILSYVRDSLTIAKYSIWTFSRYRSWFLNLAIGPFLAIAPFVFLADTLVGQGNPLGGSYFDDLGYSGYVGFLVVPLMAVNLSNTVFSWISGLIRQEQYTGTLERVLVTVQFPSTLFIGRALAHSLYMFIFVAATLLLVSIWVRPDFNINPVAGISVVVLHLLAVYGMAFLLSSAFLRITDSWAVQTVLTRTLLAILAGATFPITLFPTWLQIVARVFPFTWIFDMERRALLRSETVGDMTLDFAVVIAMTVVMWAAGFVLLNRELKHTRRTGMLGRF
ncbi:MAG: ABC transporter permease [Chloroflexi bacterium]|nr:ABC transporter permease [Chloroflexota bacterium]